jgi:hypothetical protein
MNFLALFLTLPTRQSASRMRVWRALRALGCATLRDGVYLLPAFDGNPEFGFDANAASGPHVAALTQIADDVRSAQGAADLFLLAGRDAIQIKQLVALFDRGEDYALLMACILKGEAGNSKALRALRREFSALSAIDYFPGEARRQTEEALAALEAVATGEPSRVLGKIRSLAVADYQAQTWATRRHLWVDRLASAWLIRRFIDRQAKFIGLDDPKDCPPTALGFDFDGARFTHIDGRVTFEVLATSFGVDADPAIARLGALVHCLDVGGVPVAEAAGVEAVLAGLRNTASDDEQLLNEANCVFDGLYNHFQQENSHD